MKKRAIPILLCLLSTFMLLSGQSYQVHAQEADHGVELTRPASEAVAVPFTASIGVDQFTSYRMNLSGDFVGTQDGLPTSGTFAGFVDATNNPEAQHVQLQVDGSAFTTIAPLGVLEAFKVNNSYYVQHPQSGAWITVPAFLVGIMAPEGVPDIADSIQLPLTAVPHAGIETINGKLTKRYAFGPENMAPEIRAKFNNIEGTIWVAVNGNFVMRYEATLSGQLDGSKLNAGPIEGLLGLDLTLPDDGTTTLHYELSDINSAMTIELPPGVGGFNLFDWF